MFLIKYIAYFYLPGLLSGVTVLYNTIEELPMGDIKNPAPVKYFCGVISASQDAIPFVRSALIKILGETDIEAGPFRWDHTSYYAAEMGEGLTKYFFSFKQLLSPSELSIVKIKSNHIEDEAAELFPIAVRPVNLDPGYITPSSMILASTKNYSHRIYIGGGIYAQVDYLFREKGRIEFNPWVYPDYKTTEYLEFFLEMRKKLLIELKQDKKGV